MITARPLSPHNDLVLRRRPAQHHGGGICNGLPVPGPQRVGGRIPGEVWEGGSLLCEVEVVDNVLLVEVTHV